ncbi:restriction endonuclease subunit S [Winogradskyella sp. ECml5-4]|uniref:restriction endonuclease subunit S n=1 Tax=Winogradskyella sp. ECml5-4 TaxID=3110975 RepID=UPI002FF2C3E0
MQKEKQLVPQLRFSEFEGIWKEKKYNQIYSFYSTNSFSRDNLNYQKGEVKNIHYGDIHTKFQTVFDITKEKVPFINSEISLSKIKEENYCKEGDLLIADASEDYNDIGKTIEIINLNNEKLISGLHTFLARPNKHKMAIGFTGYLLQSWKVRKQIMTIAQGTKVLGLATSRLGKVNLTIPTYEEQQKIANFLTAIDNRIQTLEKKKSLLEQYKKGVLQKIFKQELRFKDDDGNKFPKWEKRKFADVLFEHKLKSTGKEEVHSVSVHKGVINQIEHLGRSFAAKDTNKYNRALPNDIIYTKSPTGDFPLGIIKQNHIKEDVILSPLYGVFTPETKELGYILHVFFESPINTSNYLSSIIQKGAKNTINITNTTFLSKKMLLPVSKKEQIKIANFLSAIDKNIDLVNTKIEHTKSYKKGLLQQMFV